MNVSEILDGAADLIERDGWLQGIDSDFSHGPRCVLAAMGSLSESGRAASPTIEDACNKLRLAIGGNFIWLWNDAPGRTKAEVVAMLHTVAATERARAAVAVEREGVTA